MATVEDQAALERALLAAIARDPEGRHQALAVVRSGDFRTGRHRAIYTALATVASAEGDPDVMAVTDALERGGDLDAAGGREYVEEVLAADGSDADRLGQRVAENARRRRLARVAEQVALSAADRSASLDDIVGNAVDRLMDAGSTDDGIVTAREVRDDVEAMMTDGLDYGWRTGWPSLDNMYRPAAKYWTVVTGIPSHGKSTVLDCMLVNLAIKYDHRFVYFSAENFPVSRHVTALVQIYKSRSIDSLSSREVVEAIDWVHEHFVWINPNETTTLRGILSRAQAVNAKGKLNGLVIDPWNEIEHRRPEHVEETELISSGLTSIRRAARMMDLHIWVVAHPKKMEKRRDGSIPIPELYDISGSANWYNKADCGVVIYRDKDSDPTRTEVYIKKIRFKEHGREGQSTLIYEPSIFSFRSPGQGVAL